VSEREPQVSAGSQFTKPKLLSLAIYVYLRKPDATHEYFFTCDSRSLIIPVHLLTKKPL